MKYKFLTKYFFEFFHSDCSIQTDQVVIEDEEQHWQTLIHFNDLIIDVKKGTEVAPLETNANATEDGQVRRTFK